jgi:hypothetical protein
MVVGRTRQWVKNRGHPSHARDGWDRLLCGGLHDHVRDEYSTYTWILSGLLNRAGFEVEHHVTPSPMYAEFVCRRS